MTIVPLHKTPNKVEAEKIVHELAAKGLVSWSKHAKERMEERGITTQQVPTCLAKGKVVEHPILANKKGSAGGYEIAMERLTAGDYLRVILCLRFSQTVLVVTVMKIK